LPRILVTGADGFIGRTLCPGLAARGHAVVGATRRGETVAPGIAARGLGDIGPATDWSPVLQGVDVVIHLAGRAHRAAPAAALALEAPAAGALAHAAARAGVRRLIYFSSLKAMGGETPLDRPFRVDDVPRPADVYGRAKLATEQALQHAAGETGLGLVIVRPPLVYGPGVKANFRALIRLAGSGLPLPFAAVANLRSLIFIDNLVDLVARAVDHLNAAGRILLARDNEEWSTPALIETLAAAQGRRARLFAVPPAIFSGLRTVPGLGDIVGPLTLSLRVDDAPTRAALDWTPPVAALSGLAATAHAFT
jgi:nucleoside-diphosphate-sugar epimerase